MMQQTVNLENILVETIKEVLENVFDSRTALTLLRYIGQNSEAELDSRVECFSDSLHKILGNGAMIIEDLVLENLFSKLNVKQKWRKDYKFTDYLQLLRKGTGI